MLVWHVNPVLKGLWAAIDPTEGVDAAVDQKALALIGLYVADHHKATLAACETARDAWEALKAVYRAKSNACRLYLRRELHNLKLQPAESLSVYFSRARTSAASCWLLATSWRRRRWCGPSWEACPLSMRAW